MMIKIEENEAHLWGATNENGDIVIPYKYDEITHFGDRYYCRIWRSCVWYDSTGEGYSCSKAPKWWLPNIDTSMNNIEEVIEGLDRTGLDNVPLQHENGVYIKYENGKFGVLDDGKHVILPCQFDMLWRWGACDVIETRIGTRHLYFNLQGQPILTKHSNGPVDDWLSPYTIAEQQNDIALMTMEFVDSCYDEQCCMCYGHPTRLDRVLRQNIELIMRQGCVFKEFPQDAFYRFNGWDTYLYRAYVAHGSGENPVGDCVRQLREMRCYGSSWSYLDKVMTNENTELSDDELELLSYAATDCGDSKTKIGYGIDERLKDGEVKVMHIEYFADHWPNSDELERELPFDNLVNCLNPFYDNWRKSKAILEKHKGLSSHGLLAYVAHSASMASTKKEINFCYNATKWGLEHGWNPNEPLFGRTALDHIQNNISSLEKSATHSKVQLEVSRKIQQLLIDNGATTLFEQRKKNPFFREEDFKNFE